jgi:hypothetical protein
MMSKLPWSVPILAVLAILVCYNLEDEPACDESRPVFGASTCCERHRVIGASALATEADRRARISPLARP